MVFPLQARDPREAHRVATTLELFVDLAVVIAVAAAAAALHHAIAENHLKDGVISFIISFFAVWWAWMTYTWLASAFDDGSANFRIATCVFLGGALVLAAGVETLTKDSDIRIVATGYTIMRLALVWLWLGAGRSHPALARTATRYTIGIVVMQIFWLAFAFGAFATSDTFLWIFFFGVACELLVPFLAERAGATPWHGHHIVERFGLLTIIVIGEMLLASVVSLRLIIDEPTYLWPLAGHAVSCLVIACCFWWLYFVRGEHHPTHENRRATWQWSYGHFLVFASIAATGAGLAAMADGISHHAHAPMRLMAFATSLPIALFLFGLWFVRDRPVAGHTSIVLPLAATACLLAALTPLPAEAMAAALAVAVFVLRPRSERREHAIAARPSIGTSAVH